ncbi:non-specific lipid transfer protein GPI-anchored 25-like isoform X2 [Dioscorea cayenensis subsp. rotundata]|uniref:Non-specific lipid transfer protein GPI-anchored 25-like isoform X2 n=1 Tax=Dioscorea cayennensis subsp. rotundata TaxID=55577 RepID=A0AB40CNQ7_DIOCR|nr:non-specific lipid transfer protein GPI-anchored 25-like isoform X2 [Dioscorea cayenensis subsp. rotundata]
MATKPHLLLLILIILLSVFRPSASPPPPASSSSMPCTDELVAISPCLPTLAEDSDGGSTAPSTSCCANFFAAVDGTWSGPACLCHLIREPILLGFPVNGSLFTSLFVSCGRSAADAKNFSDLCRGIRRLPSFRNVTEEGTADTEAEAPSPKPPAQQPLPEASSSLLIRRKKKGRRGSSAGRVVWDQSIQQLVSLWIPFVLLLF